MKIVSSRQLWALDERTFAFFELLSEPKIFFADKRLDVWKYLSDFHNMAVKSMAAGKISFFVCYAYLGQNARVRQEQLDIMKEIVMFSFKYV